MEIGLLQVEISVNRGTTNYHLPQMQDDRHQEPVGITNRLEEPERMQDNLHQEQHRKPRRFRGIGTGKISAIYL